MAESNAVVGIEIKGNTKSLRTELKEAVQELARLQNSANASSKEIAEAAKRAGQLRDRIGDAKATVDAFNPDAKFKAFGQTVVGIAGAFTAVQGALALVGVESEDVQKTLLKVQGALALSEGLNRVLELKDAFSNLSIQVTNSSLFIRANAVVTAIAGSVMKIFAVEVQTTSFAFRALRGAIIATGIGALVIALGFAVEAFKDFATSAETARKAQEKLNDEAVEGAKRQRDFETKATDERGKQRIAEAKLAGASLQEIFTLEDNDRKAKIKSQERFILALDKNDKSRTQAEIELKTLERQRELAKTDFLVGENDKRKAKYAQEQEARTKKLKEEAEKRQKLAEEEAQKSFDLLVKKSGEIKIENENISDTQAEKYLTDFEKEREAIEEDFNIKAEKRAIFGESTALIEEERRIKLSDLQKKYDNEDLKSRADTDEAIVQSSDSTFLHIQANVRKEKALLEARKEFRKKVQDLEIDIAMQFGSVLQQIAGKNKELAIAGVVVEQGAAIAKIVMKTLVANAEAVALSPATLGQPLVALNTIQGVLSVASAVAAGAQAIASINSADSGGSASTGASLPSSGGGSAPIAPRFTPSAPTALDQTSLNAIGNVAARAYVVESDITGSQKRIRRIENSARI
jgi:biopolymer transport protein ExbD